MVNAEELVVKLTAEGATETEQSIERINDQVEQTGEGMGNTAEDISGFRQQIQGLLGAVVAGVSLATGFLLTKVPVIQETIAALSGTVDVLALKLDETLRPAVSDVNDELFDLQKDLDESDTAAESFLDTVSTAAEIEDIVIEATVDFVVEGDVSDFIDTQDIGRAAALVFDDFTVDDLPVERLGRLYGFGIEIAINRAAEDIKAGAEIADSVVDNIVSGFEEREERVVNWFLGLAARLALWASDLASDAYGWGQDVVQEFTDGLGSLLNRVRDRLDEIQSTVEAKIGVDVSGGGDGGSIGTSGGLATGGGDTEIRIDGRRIDSQTGRFGKDRLTRRGL
jgi:hypothetical protein